MEILWLFWKVSSKTFFCLWSSNLLCLFSHLSCCVSVAQPGYALAAGPCATTLPTLLPDPGAARRGQFESWVQSQSLRSPPGAGRCPLSFTGPCACHPAVQRRTGSHCWQSVVPGAQQTLVATGRVLPARYPWLCPSSGLELCPAPGLATQSHPQPAAATVGAAVCHRSETEMSFTCFICYCTLLIVPLLYKILLRTKETGRCEQETFDLFIILPSLSSLPSLSLHLSL